MLEKVIIAFKKDKKKTKEYLIKNWLLDNIISELIKNNTEWKYNEIIEYLSKNSNDNSNKNKKNIKKIRKFSKEEIDNMIANFLALESYNVINDWNKNNERKEKIYLNFWWNTEEINIKSTFYEKIITILVLVQYEKWYTDLHLEALWCWQKYMLRWRKDQLLYKIKLKDFYDILIKYKNYYINILSQSNEDYEEEIVKFLFVINYLLKKEEIYDLDELLDKTVEVWENLSIEDKRIAVSFLSNIFWTKLEWQNNKIYDVSFSMILIDKNWKENKFDIRLNAEPFELDWKHYYSIVTRLLVTKFIDVSYWDYDKIVNTSIEWKWVVIIWWKTNSWKSTSIYSMLKKIHKNNDKIAITSIEDPIEKKLDFVEQLEVRETWDEETTIWFKEHIKALVRRDWNIAFIWEIRDEESLSGIINLSNIWYGIFTTTHISNIRWLKERIWEMKWNLKWLVNNLKLLIVQQLLPLYKKTLYLKEVEDISKINNSAVAEIIDFIKNKNLNVFVQDFYDKVKYYEDTLKNNIIYNNKNAKYYNNYKKLVDSLESIEKFYRFIWDNFKIEKEKETKWMELVYEIAKFSVINRKAYLNDEEKFIKNEKIFLPIFINALIILQNKDVSFSNIIELANSY